jgi:hypothetical protein
MASWPGKSRSDSTPVRSHKVLVSSGFRHISRSKTVTGELEVGLRVRSPFASGREGGQSTTPGNARHSDHAP